MSDEWLTPQVLRCGEPMDPLEVAGDVDALLAVAVAYSHHEAFLASYREDYPKLSASPGIIEFTMSARTTIGGYEALWRAAGGQGYPRPVGWWQSFALLAACLYYVAMVSAQVEFEDPELLAELRDNAVIAIAMYWALREWGQKRGYK